MNQSKLAQLIYSVASYDGYNTSVLQTQKNLSSSKKDRKFSNPSDEYIFDDLVKAIEYASKQDKVTVDVLKQINGQMNSKKEGQPENPGILRENVEIHAGDYVPPRTVRESTVQKVIDTVQEPTIANAWELYARLAKLQPFDDGNKRTALIAANLFIGSLNGKTEDYLIIPTDFRRSQFDANLVYYYHSDPWGEGMPDEAQTLAAFVSFATHFTENNKNTFKARVEQATQTQRYTTEEPTKTIKNSQSKRI